MTAGVGTGDPRLDGPPSDIDPATVEAVGKVTEALETVEIARGHLYAFHQITGSADFKLGDAVEALREAGHEAFAREVSTELVGRNVIGGRWTFQVVEEYDDLYYQVFRDVERRARELTGGERHLWEAGLKRDRRTDGEPGHEATPRQTEYQQTE